MDEETIVRAIETNVGRLELEIADVRTTLIRIELLLRNQGTLVQNHETRLRAVEEPDRID